jgi:hypothetical protein
MELAIASIDYPDFLYSLFCSYALMPSAICKRSPVLFLFGLSGSGKSTAGKLIGKARNLPLLSSSDTFPSIRNNLNQMKYGTINDDDETELDFEYEQNAIMVWDDLDPQVLLDQPNIFRMLKFGCDRSTQWISISSQKAGTNMRFGTFAPKVISSVSPIWSLPKLSELERRSIVFPHKKTDRTLDNLDLINFHGFSDLYNDFWSNEEHCKRFALARKRLNRKGLDPMYIDWISTGLALDYFDESEAIDIFNKYNKDILEPIKNKSSLAFLELLKDFIETRTLISQKIGRDASLDPSELIKACSQ